MKIYQSTNPEDFKSYDTTRIYNDFLVTDIFVKGQISLHYSFNDRIIFGGVVPLKTKKLELKGRFEQLKSNGFLERRELGVLNLGGQGRITVDGIVYILNKLDCLYVGLGAKELVFESTTDDDANFYLASAPAHKYCDTSLITQKQAIKKVLGSQSECNCRCIYQYILPECVKSCQLAMGFTVLDDGSVWNTMPCHTHDRRMEVYLYTDIKEGQAVFHFMGQPTQTRHITVQNNQAVISPSWSIHSGVGTKNYSFVWAMCGENQQYDDMDVVKASEMR
ncbi:MAG: 5-dehydro-4-deoxy-D-glucuronate isomerase [Clostridiales bacterium]|jgi:4-deoxy-L-threo-5-hexosulose-uronate ketol-isomerase|nr:5-dehydro-4-deoxy-D-glucuronate isomerase [Clostridiales bacterium]